MKKSLIFMALVMVLCFCTSSYGADAAGHQWYMGIGGSWAIDNFDTDDLEDDLAPIDVDFDDAWGVNASIGYHVNDNFSIAFVYSYLADFNSDESVSGAFNVGDIADEVGLDENDLELLGLDPNDEVGFEVGAELELDIMTFMLEAKYAMSGNVRPFAVVGVGLMYADADGDVKATVDIDGSRGSASIGDSDSDTRACGKVGLGVDWFATPNVSVGLEGSYVFAFGDHEFDDLDAETGIRYFNIGLGVAYHF
jgi:opacity protein-like surface antigen